jgi:DNA polymerase III subunit epsilon
MTDTAAAGLPLRLDRPVAIFDIEATGASPRSDRIIELAILKILPDGTREMRVWRVNPGCPIPAEVTRIHGITDADVAACPPFRGIAAEVDEFLEGCDLAGYNIARYDVPMLTEAFTHVGLPFNIDQRRVFDVQRIFHRREPRDLTAALAFYCGDVHTGAHGAVADVEATLRVLEGQYRRYPDLPTDADSLHDYCNPKKPGWVDREGRLRWENGEVVINFGRNKGTPLRRMIQEDPGFVKWLLKSDFPQDTRRIVEEATRGTWPAPPAAAVEED